MSESQHEDPGASTHQFRKYVEDGRDAPAGAGRSRKGPLIAVGVVIVLVVVIAIVLLAR